MAELVPLERLKPAPWNPRTISTERFKNLCRSIEADPDLLKLRPVLAQADGTIYAGNMRYRAAEHLKKPAVWAELEDVSDQLAKERAIRDNQQWGEWQEDQLSEMLFELKEAGSPLDLLGIGQDEIDRLLESVGVGGDGELGEDDADLTPPEEPITKLGDLWLLGEHRLLCGDSTVVETWERLMLGERAVLCFTSPPYNAGHSPAAPGSAREYNKYIGHDDSLEVGDYLNLLNGFTEIALSHCELVAVNIQQVAGNKVALIEYVHGFRKHLVDTAVWVKSAQLPALGQPAMGRNILNSAFEFVFLFSPEELPKRAIPTADFRGTLSNVYAAPSAGGSNEYSEIHAATFPKHLPTWAMSNLDARRGITVDPFLGTGTTLIAAEELGRCCYGIELDPRYCDVIVRRWEAVTGKTAVRQEAATVAG